MVFAHIIEETYRVIHGALHSKTILPISKCTLLCENVYGTWQLAVIAIGCFLFVSVRLLFNVLNYMRKRSCKWYYWPLLSALLLCRQFQIHAIAFPSIWLAIYCISFSFHCETIIFCRIKTHSSPHFIWMQNAVRGTGRKTVMGGLPSADSQASLVCSHDK